MVAKEVCVVGEVRGGSGSGGGYYPLDKAEKEVMVVAVVDGAVVLPYSNHGGGERGNSGG